MYISTYIHVHTNNFPIRHPHAFFVFCRKYPKHHRSVMSRDTEQFQPLAHRIGILWPGVPARIDADFCLTQTFDELFATRFAISHANRVRHFPVKFQHSTIYTIMYLGILCIWHFWVSQNNQVQLLTAVVITIKGLPLLVTK